MSRGLFWTDPAVIETIDTISAICNCLTFATSSCFDLFRVSVSPFIPFFVAENGRAMLGRASVFASPTRQPALSHLYFGRYKGRFHQLNSARSHLYSGTHIPLSSTKLSTHAHTYTTTHLPTLLNLVLPDHISKSLDRSIPKPKYRFRARLSSSFLHLHRNEYSSLGVAHLLSRL